MSCRNAFTKSATQQLHPARLPAEMNGAELNLLFAECIPRLSRTARRMLRNQQDSEDVMQDCLLLAYRKLDQFEERASFSTWLHSILRNAATRYYRRVNAHPTGSIEDMLLDAEGDLGQWEVVDSKPDPEQNYVSEERSAIFRGVLRTLPTHYQNVLYQFYAMGLCETDAARMLGISVAALKTRLHRGRILLMRRLRRGNWGTDPRALQSSRVQPLNVVQLF